MYSPICNVFIVRWRPWIGVECTDEELSDCESFWPKETDWNAADDSLTAIQRYTDR